MSNFRKEKEKYQQMQKREKKDYYKTMTNLKSR